MIGDYETGQQIHENWIAWCDRRGMEGLADHLRSIPVARKPAPGAKLEQELGGICIGDKVRWLAGTTDAGTVFRIEPEASRPYHVLYGWGSALQLARNEIEVLTP